MDELLFQLANLLYLIQILKDGSSRGSGRALFNVKGDTVKDGSSLGTGRTIGKVKDFTIKGMERELDAEIVATYHF